MYNYRDLFDRDLPDDFFNMNMDMGMNMNPNMNMIPNMSSNNGNSMSLFTPAEGYNKGNLFSNLYTGYKNYKPENLEGRDNKSRLWLEMNRTLFALHELNLYLDVNPKDDSMLRLFSDYRRRANELIDQYEREYGPLTTLSETNNNSTFNWIEGSFPWEGGNN